MTDLVKVALIAATPSTISAIIGWRNNVAATKIHGLVNSSFSAVKVDLIAAQEEVRHLRELVIVLQDRITRGSLPDPSGASVPPRGTNRANP